MLESSSHLREINKLKQQDFTDAEGFLKLQWTIEEADLRKVTTLIEGQKKKNFVKKRMEKNTSENQSLSFQKEQFWEIILMCLLSTQQRAGPRSAVSRFFNERPFPLNLEVCTSHTNRLGFFIEEILTRFGGLRRAKTIGREASHNLNWLSENGWSEIHGIVNELVTIRMQKPNSSFIPIERKAANFVSDNLKGFGPKQSRNLWQTLGLFRFEIPLDSRITKWLNRNGFPIKLSAEALSDINYYEFVMTGIQELCKKCGILPCVLDAAIFASFDQDWDDDELIW